MKSFIYMDLVFSTGLHILHLKWWHLSHKQYSNVLYMHTIAFTLRELSFGE